MYACEHVAPNWAASGSATISKKHEHEMANGDQDAKSQLCCVQALGQRLDVGEKLFAFFTRFARRHWLGKETRNAKSCSATFAQRAYIRGAYVSASVNTVADP